MVTCSLEREGDRSVDAPALIEGLPGHGLVASIAVDHIKRELDLGYYAGIRAEEVPPVLSFSDGLARDTVRVYSGTDPDVLTLHSDVKLPEKTYRDFSACVLHDLADEIDRGVFLAAAPAKSEEQHGEVRGVATAPAVRDEMDDAGITMAEGDGLAGGITGALVDTCYHEDVPAALILVRADPHVPDPQAAQAVIDEAIEPLLGFDIDTDPLLEQAREIQEQKAQVVQQLQEAQAQGEEEGMESPSVSGMYQ